MVNEKCFLFVMFHWYALGLVHCLFIFYEASSPNENVRVD